MSLKHLVFIINPRSGVKGRRAPDKLIRQHLDHNLYTHRILYTDHAGHASTLAREAAEDGAYAVIATGGDGSVNEVATGLQGTDTRLGILPYGSGNGLARTLGIPLRPEHAIAVINRNNTMAIDTGTAGGHLFLSNAGVGFDAVISGKFAQSKTRGFISYALLVTTHLWTYRSKTWRIHIDGQELRERAFLVNVANGRQFGYNFRIAPQADLQDGMLDLVIIRDFPKLSGISILLSALRGTLNKNRHVITLRGKDIRISHPGLRLMQTDGDAHTCEGEVQFGINSRAQLILVP